MQNEQTKEELLVLLVTKVRKKKETLDCFVPRNDKKEAEGILGY
jgi:hypothetical protein